MLIFVSAIGLLPAPPPRHEARRTSAAVLSRRQLLALTIAGAAQLPALPVLAAPDEARLRGFVSERQQGSKLKPAALSAVTDFYGEDFCAFLARWLIRYEPSTTRWWADKQADARAAFETAPSTKGTQFGHSNDARRQLFLRSKFENLVTSVEVGLEKVPGPKGAQQLAEVLTRRCPTKNSKRYLAQLFSPSRRRPTNGANSLADRRSR